MIFYMLHPCRQCHKYWADIIFTQHLADLSELTDISVLEMQNKKKKSSLFSVKSIYIEYISIFTCALHSQKSDIFTVGFHL